VNLEVSYGVHIYNLDNYKLGFTTISGESI